MSEEAGKQQPSGRSQRRVKNLIVNPRFQMKYILWVTFSGLGLVAMNATIFYSYLRENYSILVDLSPMTDEAKLQLYSELHSIIWQLAGVSAAFLGLVSLMGLFFSHKTAGPLYHFKKVFESIASGDRKARIRLRPKDEFQDVAQSFNAMMDQLSSDEASKRK